MSKIATDWVWSQRLTAAQKLLLLALADCSNDNGECDVPLNDLSMKCGTSRGAIIKARNFLIANNYLDYTKRYYGDFQLSNHYKLNLCKKASEPEEEGCSHRRNMALRFTTKRRVRAAIFERDGYFCSMCKTVKDLTLDHIIPVKEGGEDKLENLRVLCRLCNSSKGSPSSTNSELIIS